MKRSKEGIKAMSQRGAFQNNVNQRNSGGLHRMIMPWCFVVGSSFFSLDQHLMVQAKIVLFRCTCWKLNK